MIGHKTRGGLLGLMLLALTAPPAEAQCCGGWRSWFGGAPARTTYYAPYTASYAPAGYGQVVNYVPQTSYRTVYMNAPVVAYSPVTACNACGGATTVMRPVTTYMMQPRLIPYTTYRPVVVAPVVPACATGCAPVASAAAYYAPSVPTYPVAAQPVIPASPYLSAPPVLSTPLSAGAPGTTVRALVPTPAYPTAPGAYPGPPSLSAAPSLPPDTSAAPPAAPPQPSDRPSPTFRDSDNQNNNNGDQKDNTQNNDNQQPSNNQPQSRILLPQRPESSNSNTSGTRVLEPEEQDRTTALPLRQGYAVRQASLVTPIKTAAEKLDDSGWRAAKQ